MPFNIHQRSFIALEDMTAKEINFLLDLAANLKIEKYSGTEQPALKNKNIALIFEKSSTRTRCAFEIAAHDQGAHVTYLGPTGSQIGVKESMKDTARVLGRMYDAIEFRGFKQESVQELAEYANVPILNGLTDKFHPTQILADFLTMGEHTGKHLSDVSFCFLGDGENNMGNSLMMGAAKLGLDFRMASPKQCRPSRELITECESIARDSGAKLTFTDNIAEAVKDCDFIYTDVWVSMGDPDSVWKERIELLLPFQVNRKVMEMTGKATTKFMHCLPAFHNRETEKGEKIFQKYGLEELEVSDEVFESEASIVFDQAENRVHTIKAVLVATLAS